MGSPCDERIHVSWGHGGPRRRSLARFYARERRERAVQRVDVAYTTAVILLWTAAGDVTGANALVLLVLALAAAASRDRPADRAELRARGARRLAYKRGDVVVVQLSLVIPCPVEWPRTRM